jgi:hypothetical protein
MVQLFWRKHRSLEIGCNFVNGIPQALKFTNVSMINTYLEKLKNVLNLSRSNLATEHILEFKHVFGAIGGYINGRIFIVSGKFGVAFRLPEDTLSILFQTKRARHLKYFPKGHIKKEYAVFSKRLLVNKLQLKKIVDESIRYVLQ